MTIKEKYNRIVSEYGTAIILVKKQIVFNKNNHINEENIYLHSFKLDTFLTTEEPWVICSIYSALKHQFYTINCKLGSKGVWKWDDEEVEVIRNDHEIQENCLKNFSEKLNLYITDTITSFLPSENNFARRFGTAVDYTSIVLSSENVGLLTNSLLDHINTKEENFYLSDARIDKGTEKNLIECLTDKSSDATISTIPGMTTPNGTVHSIELNGAFRISFK